MPIFHTVNEKFEIVLSSWIGCITDSDLLPSYRRLYENERWKPGFRELADLRNADMRCVTSEGMRELNALVKRYTVGKCGEFKTAVIAPEDLPFGLARGYELVSFETPEVVMVFRDQIEAFEWLGVENFPLN